MEKSQIISWGKFLIGWPLSLISLGFIAKLVLDKSGELSISFATLNFFFLAISILVFFGYYLLRSFLWQFILSEKGNKIGFIENTYRFTFSELKRYTPGNIWSFLSRASQFTDLGIDKKTVGISLLADIQLVIIGSLIASIPAIPWLLNSPQALQSKIFSVLPFVVIAILIYFVAGSYVYRKKYDSDTNIINSLFLPGFKYESKIKLIAISSITYFIFGVGNFLALQSINAVSFSNFITLSSFFTLSLLLGYLSFITPTGLGIREALVTLGLTKIMSIADAGIVSIFTRIMLIASEVTFLVLVILWQKTSKK